MTNRNPCGMLTYSCYHAARPLPAGVSLAALLFQAPAGEALNARKISPMGITPEDRTHERSPTGKALFIETSFKNRIKTYRPVMLGQGWKNVAWISAKTGISRDSVRQRLLKLEDSGHVEVKKSASGDVMYRWIGS